MRRLAAAALLAAALALAGCGALDPYPTAPRAASAPPPGSPAGPPSSDRVAICYNTLTTTLAEVQRQAQQQCPAGRTAQPADTDWYLIACPLLLPARATFACAPNK